MLPWRWRPAASTLWPGPSWQKARSEGRTPAETEDFTALPGNGLTAKLGGRTLVGGSLRFLSEQTDGL